MVTIEIKQSLINSAIYLKKRLEKYKLYKTVGKYDDQNKYKAITESDMASTTEGLTY